MTGAVNFLAAVERLWVVVAAVAGFLDGHQVRMCSTETTGLAIVILLKNKDETRRRERLQVVVAAVVGFLVGPTKTTSILSSIELNFPIVKARPL